MIGRLLFGSARRRLRHLGLIALATTVAATTVAAAAGLGARLSGGLQGALHAAGPNLVVRPQVGGPDGLSSAALERVRSIPGVVALAGVLERSGGAEVVAGRDGGVEVLLAPRAGGGGKARTVLGVSGSFFELHPEWEVDPSAGGGSVRPGPGEALLGAEIGAAGSPGPARGRAGGSGGDDLLAVAGRFTTGGPLDRAVIVSAGELAAASGAEGGLAFDRIEVRAEPERIDEVATAVEGRVAGAEARSLARVTATAAGLARNLQALMAGVGGICLLLALVTVGSATLALLEERRREMALFLSLGYTGRWVQGLLTAELAVVGVLSVAAGAAAGEAVAAVLAGRILGVEATFAPSGAGLAAGVLVVVTVTAAAAALVRRRIESLEPAVVLQGS